MTSERGEAKGTRTMRILAGRRGAVLLAVTVATAALTVGGSSAAAAAVTVNLCANPGTATLTGAVTVPIWGFAQAASPGACAGAAPSLPGPTVVVNEGDVVTLTVTNGLPAGHTASLEVPGVSFAAGPIDIAPGSTVSRTFTAGAPGTYLYQSSGGAGRQVAMGLYGALIVRSGTANQAYDAATTAFDVEAPLVLSQVDPAFNAAPDTADMHAYHPTYWLINGKAYPNTAGITASAGQRVLLRYLNAGTDNSAMSLLGTHQRVLARDARLLNNPFDAATETIPTGATEDTILTMPATAPPSGHGFPLYNRQLHVTNGDQTGVSPLPTTGGGMLTFIHS